LEQMDLMLSLSKHEVPVLRQAQDEDLFD